MISGAQVTRVLRVDSEEYFDDPALRLGPDAGSIIVLADPVQPHSVGEIVLANVVSGNTNAASIMIGEMAAEILARDHNVTLNEFVGQHT